MTNYFTTSIGRLRLLAFMEGTSLLALVFIAVPIKYIGHDPAWVKAIGPVHGALFLAFVSYALIVGLRQKWKFMETTFMILVASFIPFGTFYVDRRYFKKYQPL